MFEVRGRTVERIVPPRGKGRVALTFDDGPGPYTPQVLAELRSLHVRATFFVIGHNAQQLPGIVRALRAAGMVVGNHSWSHPNLTKLSLARQRAQLRRTQDVLARRRSGSAPASSARRSGPGTARPPARSPRRA